MRIKSHLVILVVTNLIILIGYSNKADAQIANLSIVNDATSGYVGTLKAIQGGSYNNGTANMTVSGFRMSQHEITGEQYATVMGINDPSYFASVTNNPVEQITWYDSVEFCNKLSTLEGFTSVYTISARIPATGYPITSATVIANWNANGYRLPTETEWQFAAQGGNRTHNFIYAGSDSADSVSWYYSNSGATTHSVGVKTDNELGLYDMSGNVSEWCWDWYDWNTASYPSTPQTNYRGAAPDLFRVNRGGSWQNDAGGCTVAFREYFSPNLKSRNVGFRIVLP